MRSRRGRAGAAGGAAARSRVPAQPSLFAGLRAGQPLGRHVREQRACCRNRSRRPSTRGRPLHGRGARATSSAARCGAGGRSPRIPAMWPSGRRAPLSRRCDASNPSTSPSSRTRPSLSRTMWSATRSMSAITCDAMTTVAPVSATPSMSICRNSRAASGSSRANGSSSRSSDGRLPSASASASRERSPAVSDETRRPGGMRSSRSLRDSASQSAFVARANSTVSATVKLR